MNGLYCLRRHHLLREQIAGVTGRLRQEVTTLSLQNTAHQMRHLSASHHRPQNAQAEEVKTSLRSKMRAWQTAGYDGVNGVELHTVRMPPILRPGDILVKVFAASVNPLDTAVISGYGGDVLNLMRFMGQLEQGILDSSQTEFPLTVGRDFAGEVVSVGHGVKDVSVSDQVLGVVGPQRPGSHAEYVVTAASNVCKMPDSISHEEAASIPYAGLTGWSAVLVSGMLTPRAARRSRVLVLGASGGVGSFICQLLSSWQAQVVGVCSTDALGLVASLGVDVLDYTDPATKEMLIANGSFDLVINAAGEDDLDYLKALKPWAGSSYITLSPPLLRNIDNLGLAAGVFKSARQVLCQNATSLSDGRAYKWAFFMPNPVALKQITKMLANQKIRPVIDKVFSFAETPEAYRYVLDGHARGKTVISVS